MMKRLFTVSHAKFSMFLRQKVGNTGVDDDEGRGTFLPTLEKALKRGRKRRGQGEKCFY